ncbi:MAG: hypothetical protein CMM48_14420 [Rhodospirillaceae bacterium]|nr:hypothetical protein [Rhodospirillaceae bacterium]HAA92096.1 hypothetical protein [Rhodospirillaceae bacterium]|tara:strand:- start:99 stop:536 length:438 start_codon:yes stop_codon:yes gene_type:complete
MSFLQVIYASAASHKMSPEELAEILEVARTKNTEIGISGMLAYHEGSFLQVLEGPEEKVETLLEVIKQDPRHNKLQLLLKHNVSKKEFGDWSMAFVDTSGAAGTMEGFLGYEREFNAAIGGDKATAAKVLRDFKDGVWRRFVERK